jgi:sialate O-acetylesterase
MLCCSNKVILNNDAMNRYSLLLLLILSLFADKAQAKVRLPHILGDEMVVQQDADVRLWGWDTPGRQVRVTTSWGNQSETVKTGKDGKFLLTVHTPKASYTPLSVTFDDGEKVTLNGILSGEVWVCAGQSNMEMPMRGFGNCPVEGYNQEIIEANKYKGIHYVKIPSVMSMRPLDDANCEWKAISPETLGDCSATGYFFAQTVNRALDIPVGLIMANKGGTRVESWLDADNLKKYTQESLDSMTNVKKFPIDYYRPLVWGNGTFSPILNYTVKGILFYQGCSNVGDPGDQYSQRLKLLVEQWRRDFRLGDIPFYFVQIAPFYNDDVDGDLGAKLREQQLKASKIIPNSAIVCTEDLVYPWETQQIHPTQKRQVGQRLANIALNKNYGMKSLMYKSPEVKDYRFSNDTCYVNLQNDYDAVSRFEDIQGFELAGEDKVFHKADAHYYWGKGIGITCPEVTKPVAVRYCFRNFLLGNVANAAGLPLFPFRSDNW